MAATDGSRASARSRSVRAVKSIMGCGRPTVNSSAPRSIAVWSRLGAPWGSAYFLSAGAFDQVAMPASFQTYCASVQ
jgi:hypothetical protein